MRRIGPFTIARTSEIELLFAKVAASAVQHVGTKLHNDAATAFVVNADLQAACQAADAYLHGRYPHLDEEQQALCAQLVDACQEAYAVNLGLTDTHLPPEVRARIKARVDALLSEAA